MKSLIIPINRAFLFLFLSIFCLVYFQSTAWAASYTINTSKGNLSSGVQLDWTSTNGPNVTYQIYRSLGLNGTKALLTSVSNANTYTDTTATPGIVYGYYVKESGDATQSSNDFGYRTQTTSTIMGTGDYVKVFATDGDPNSYASSSFALKSDGRLFASGYNAWGQLGDGTNTDSTKFKQVLTGVQDMVAGLQTSLALKTDGTLWAVGLGYGYTWTQVLSGVSSLSGFYAIKSGTAYSGSSPTNWASTGYTNIKAISSSAGYTYTLATDGTLKAWWSDYYGVHNSTIGTGIKKIQAGYESSCYYSCSYYPFVYGIKNDNSLWVYGGLNFGHGLGLRPSTGLQYVLNDVDDVQINSGSMTVLAKKTDGTLWSTSKSSNGLDGDGTSTPTSYWKQVFDNVAYASPGLAHSMVLRTNGTIWVSGLNVKGAHGLGDTTSRTVWTQTGVLGNLIASKGTVNGSVDLFWESDYGTGVNYEIWRSNGLTGTKSKIATTTLNTYSDTTASYGVTSGIVYDYHVQTIGGQKTNTDYGYRTPASNAITGSGTYSKVSAGVSHSLALKSDGRLFAAGSNGSGELGDASTTASGTFKQVLTGVQDMIAGNAVSLALKTDGTLWAVGQGYGTTWAQVLSGVSSLSGFYAIKSGTAYSGSSPTNWASTGYTGIKQLLMGTSSYGSMSGSSSGTHPVLLKTDGSVVTVSTGYYGVEYTTIGTGFKKIALTASYWVGSYSGGTSWGLVGIKNDGTLWLYGAAKSNIASGSGFIQILNNVIDVSTNNTNYQIFATHNDGSLWANTYTQPGIYGDGTTTETSYWKQVFANVSNTSAGANHTLALRSNGTIWVTGQNASKQHGLNDTTNRTTWTQTGFILPAKVTGVSATDGTQYSKVAVGWTADPDATQYDVFRSNCCRH